MTKETTSLSCPTCKKPIEWSDRFPFRPFCCERCKLIDLGEWASEGHRIPGEPAFDDVLSGELEQPGTRH
ncbi:DNA gyrase inhibitor YacG [Microbulbifer thermotolerans]|uniref:DNA gyrase inhibitor YacG n=1 Tax=Microbulbifer thermotolerans TaxID=252514 RepID=A0A143HRF6_MICTH|nr:DNA gyrase inhibitor YacG [Microbulbifer thermotolerans]AMX04071.1 DNA gyrase inhibitor [Microbulbifer thermotolerans]MCX2780738.1 DNA gyrase inhibitor YacG [Microbulbifer thermotolerans]MCX2793869.1 DNA gyrase inhibitor YacG [Microbulbifer thermotolerans]MCX2806463.1 DNA gyrase inhibitor YacG [Microbulbifer thermotolerans]MCX2830105.1 DNA gyrase inhibitor YacG [Microbulbifer thermotolerans]